LAQLLAATDAAVPYQVVSGSDIAYGVVPLVPAGTQIGLIGVQGVPVMLFGMSSTLDLFDGTKDGISLEPREGRTIELAFVVAAHAPGTAAPAGHLRGQPTQEIAGRVIDADGQPVAGAKVTLYRGGNPGPTLGEHAMPWTFFRTAADGSFGGAVASGNYVAQARLTFDRVSPVVAVAPAGTQTSIQMPGIASWDYTVLDA